MRARELVRALAPGAAAFLYGAAVLAAAGVIPVLRFTRERIDIAVRRDSFAVDALYVYKNPWPFPVAQGLRIPFADDADLGPPVTVEVVELGRDGDLPERPIPVRWSGGEPRFAVAAPAGAEATVRVRFTQRAERGAGRYLLLTTRPWGRPLARGEYALHPDGVRITGSNYRLDRDGGMGFDRQDFMPGSDWRFTWTPDAD